MKHAQNQVVLITGCSSGIGLALAREFGRGDFTVCATALPGEENGVPEGGAAEMIACDVTEPRSVRACVRRVLTRHGRIDILVNNAGIGVIGPSAELAVDDFRRQFEVNFFGALTLMGETLPHMMQRRSGTIVNMGSVSGVLATPFAGAYCASKAALHAVSDSLRMELAPLGIRVFTVQPGAVRSNWGIAASRDLGRFRKPSSAYAALGELIEGRAKTHLLNPTAAEDLAEKIVKIVSSRARGGVVRLGNESHRLPFLRWLLPQALLDRIMRRRFGLDRLAR